MIRSNAEGDGGICEPAAAAMTIDQRDPVAAGLAHKLGADAYARTPTAAAGLIGSLH